MLLSHLTDSDNMTFGKTAAVDEDIISGNFFPLQPLIRKVNLESMIMCLPLGGETPDACLCQKLLDKDSNNVFIEVSTHTERLGPEMVFRCSHSE